MNISQEQLAQMIDISAVRTDSTADEVELVVKAARQHRFICVFTLPSMAALAKRLLDGEKGIYLGGTVGFPSGASTTSVKALEADELLNLGCHELDMVINVGKLKSNLYGEVAADIHKIVQIAGTVPVKAILEVNVLKDAEIQDGAKIILDSGAQFVKTGTGWLGATTFEHIKLIKAAVGENIKLKVAGGVRNLDLLLKMYESGVCRFGISRVAAVNIMDEFYRSKKD